MAMKKIIISFLQDMNILGGGGSVAFYVGNLLVFSKNERIELPPRVGGPPLANLQTDYTYP